MKGFSPSPSLSRSYDFQATGGLFVCVLPHHLRLQSVHVRANLDVLASEYERISSFTIRWKSTVFFPISISRDPFALLTRKLVLSHQPFSPRSMNESVV